jgi:hypothetical protein
LSQTGAGLQKRFLIHNLVSILAVTRSTYFYFTAPPACCTHAHSSKVDLATCTLKPSGSDLVTCTLKPSGSGHMHTKAKWIWPHEHSSQVNLATCTLKPSGSGHMHTQAKWIWPHAHSSQVDLATCTLKPSGSCHMHTQANWILQVDLATCTLRSLMISSKHMAPSLDRTSVNTCRAHASQLYSVHYSRHDDADEFILKNGAMTARAAPKHV